MTIFVNGEGSELAPGTTVRALLDALAVPGGSRGVAVAVDAEVVPAGSGRRRRSTTARGSRSCARSREAEPWP